MSVGRAGAVIVLITSVAAFGCVHTVTQQVAPFKTDLPDPAVTKRAPESAVYQVKVFDHGKYRGVAGTERLVSRGDALGFRTAADGSLYGVAGDEAIPLRLPPRRAVAWYAVYEKQTHLGREVEKALGAAGDVATTAGALGLVGATAAADAYLDSLDDQDCDRAAAARGRGAREHDHDCDHAVARDRHTRHHGDHDHHDHHHGDQPTTRP